MGAPTQFVYNKITNPLQGSGELELFSIDKGADNLGVKIYKTNDISV